MTRRVPASVDLTGKSVKLDITYKGPIDTEFRALLDSKLLPLLAGREGKGVRLVKTGEDAVLSAQILSAEVKSEKNKSKRGIGMTSDAITYSGKTEATLEVMDGKGKPLDAGSLDYKFLRRGLVVNVVDGGTTAWIRKTVAQNAPSNSELKPQELKKLLADGLAHKIARRIVNLDETFDVQLPAGAVFEPVKKAVQGQKWGAALEAAEKLQVDDRNLFAKEYLIGLTNEALAYVEHDQTKVVDLLNRADEHYEAAARKKADEKPVLEATDRVKDSIEYYLAMQSTSGKGAELTSAAEPMTPKSKSAGPSESPAPAPKYTDGENSALIFLKNSGATNEILISYINTTENPHYDLTAGGLGALLKAGIAGPVLETIQKKMKPAPSSGRTKP